MSEIPEEIRKRLEAAERVCVLYGWTGVTEESERSKALHELWSEWVKMVSPGFTSRAAHPDLSDERIAELAARRDEIREQTLARMRDGIPERTLKRMQEQASGHD
jgi:hypothetical protein